MSTSPDMKRFDELLKTSKEAYGAAIMYFGTSQHKARCAEGVLADNALRDFVAALVEDRARLDWLDASDARGVNRLAHESDGRKGHVFDKARIPDGAFLIVCDHYHGANVREAIDAARKASS